MRLTGEVGQDAFGGLLFGYHDADEVCECVAHHSPKPTHLVRHHIVPLSYGGPDTETNTIWLCQSTHGNVHRLLWDYERLQRQPPWRGFRWYYSAFTRNLAEQAWAGRMT